MTQYCSLTPKPGLQSPSNDLRAAEIGLLAEPMLLEDALFHCQQAVEKFFKAFLTFHDRPFRKTHNLEEIGEACLEIDRDLLPLVNEAVPLSEYAWAFRYPGGSDLPDIEEARGCISNCRASLPVDSGTRTPRGPSGKTLLTSRN